MQSTQPSVASIRLRQFLTVAAILGSFAVNAWSNISPPNGASIGEISNTQFADVLITPANYAFAIWGVIYLGLIGFGVYQFLQPQNQHPKLQTISYLLVAACIAQAVWVFLFLSNLFGWSVLAMLTILVCLIWVYLQLGTCDRSPTWQEQWLLRIPFSVYLGWISVATVVNVALALYDAGWNGWGIAPEVWTVVMLVISSALAIALLIQRRDTAFSLVIIWALIAISVKRSSIPLIAISAIALAIGLGLGNIRQRSWSLRRRGDR
ncbi:MAG: tryptophan-rich sensory protein [Oscillatoriales cyanobacterium C42_A2020_001]|nr:tryptophan-rich sensory protein [Leptolyngbyaceae cyanobacterium C42_A2020_001]